jgi:hypothetical protein
MSHKVFSSGNARAPQPARRQQKTDIRPRWRVHCQWQSLRVATGSRSVA